MAKLKVRNFLLTFSLLALFSGCNGIGTAEFGDLAMGEGGKITSITFTGITSIDQITDSTATIYWSAHSGASSYTVYNVSSGSPVIVTGLQGSNHDSVTLTGLSSNTTYIF